MALEVTNIKLLNERMKKVLIPILLVFILIVGCLDNKNQNNMPQENVNQLTQDEYQNRPINGNIGNRSRLNMSNRSRGMWNMTQMAGGEHNWSANMSDRFLEMRERLNLSDNASEDEIQAVLQKMREERGMQSPGNPPENPPNNPR